MNTTTKILLAGLALVTLLAPLASASHSVTITSGKVSPGSYTMTVDVAGFNLVPFAGKTGADAHKKGEGHIHYLVNGNPAPGDYATTSKSFTFKDLKSGDKISAELVLSDHMPSGTNAQGTLDGSRVVSETKTVSSSSNGSPGVSPLLLGVALIGAVLVLQRRKA